MYCKKCGSELKKGQKFCQKCGAPVEENQESTVDVSTMNVDDAFADSKDKQAKKGAPKIIIAIVAIIAIIAVIVILVVVNRKPIINLNKYTDVSYSGYDGYGEAIVTIRYDDIDADYANKVKVTEDETTQLWFGDMSVGTALSYLASATVDIDSGLSNGDVVTVSYDTYEDDIRNMLDCTIEYETGTYTVEGLEEIQTINVFEGMDIDFTGTAPYVKAKIKAAGQFNDSYNSIYSWTVEPDSNLDNGDTVTLSLDIKDEEAFAQKFHGMPEEMSKTYTVAGMDSYITDISQLSEEDMETLKGEAKDQIDAECAQSTFRYSVRNLLGVEVGALVDSVEFGSDYTLNNIYFLHEKGTEAAKYTGVPVFIYSFSAEVFQYGDKALLKSGEIYISVAFTDLILEGDGDLVGVNTNTIKEYSSLDEAYKDWVTANKDNYTVTVYDSDLNKAE